jgi:integrase
MSSIKKVEITGKPDQWDVRWRTPDGLSRRKRFTKKGEATTHRAKVDGALVENKYVDAAAGKVTFKAYAEDWRAGQVHRPTTQAHVETMLRRHAYPHLGDRALAAVRPSEVQAWVRLLSQTLAPATVGVAHGLVAAIYKSAVKDRLVAGSPCSDTTLPEAAPHLVEPLTTEQVQALAEAVPAYYRAAVLLAAGTGLRQGEVFGLTVDRVDFLRKTMRVDRQLVTVAGRTPFLGPPKTKASHRTIPLPNVVVDALAAHLRDFPTTGQDVPVVLVGGREAGEQPVELFFTTAAGLPIRRTSFGNAWRAAVTSAKAPHGTGFHALRHYYASLLIRHGESVKVVQARLGHASAAETLDTYSHLWPDAEDRTRDAIDDVLGVAKTSRVSLVSQAAGEG